MYSSKVPSCKYDNELYLNDKANIKDIVEGANIHRVSAVLESHLTVLNVSSSPGKSLQMTCHSRKVFLHIESSQQDFIHVRTKDPYQTLHSE